MPSLVGVSLDFRRTGFEGKKSEGFAVAQRTFARLAIRRIVGWGTVMRQLHGTTTVPSIVRGESGAPRWRTHAVHLINSSLASPIWTFILYSSLPVRRPHPVTPAMDRQGEERAPSVVVHTAPDGHDRFSTVSARVVNALRQACRTPLTFALARSHVPPLSNRPAPPRTARHCSALSTPTRRRICVALICVCFALLQLPYLGYTVLPYTSTSHRSRQRCADFTNNNAPISRALRTVHNPCVRACVRTWVRACASSVRAVWPDQ